MRLNKHITRTVYFMHPNLAAHYHKTPWQTGMLLRGVISWIIALFWSFWLLCSACIMGCRASSLICLDPDPQLTLIMQIAQVHVKYTKAYRKYRRQLALEEVICEYNKLCSPSTFLNHHISLTSWYFYGTGTCLYSPSDIHFGVDCLEGEMLRCCCEASAFKAEKRKVLGLWPCLLNYWAASFHACERALQGTHWTIKQTAFPVWICTGWRESPLFK